MIRFLPLILIFAVICVPDRFEKGITIGIYPGGVPGGGLSALYGTFLSECFFGYTPEENAFCKLNAQGDP